MKKEIEPKKMSASKLKALRGKKNTKSMKDPFKGEEGRGFDKEQTSKTDGGRGKPFNE